MKKFIALCMTVLLTAAICYPVSTNAASRQRRAKTTQVSKRNSASGESRLNGYWYGSKKRGNSEDNWKDGTFTDAYYFSVSRKTFQHLEIYTDGEVYKYNEWPYTYRNGVVYVGGRQFFTVNFSKNTISDGNNVYHKR